MDALGRPIYPIDAQLALPGGIGRKILRPIPETLSYDTLTKFCKYNLKAPNRTISYGLKFPFTYYVNKLHIMSL